MKGCSRSGPRRAGWCTRSATCDSSTSDSCVGECVADVGFPGDPCAAALEALADCIAASCDEAACADELGERDATCGGTG